MSGPVLIDPAAPGAKVFFGMVTTAKSAAYTDLALASFFRTTSLGPDDRFFLLDNDGDYPPPAGLPIEHVVNRVPRSFAENVNDVLGRAATALRPPLPRQVG